MPVVRNAVDPACFNGALSLPYGLRIDDFRAAIQDVYDFLYDVNSGLEVKGMQRLEVLLRPAIMSGVLSDLLTASLAKHSRVLVENAYHNGHPDLIVRGQYPNDGVRAGEMGVEVKTTLKAGGAVDMHGARDQWLCVFVYRVDTVTQPAVAREPLTIAEVYCGHVTVDDFRRNARGELGTRTATLHADGIKRLRESWVYRLS